MQDVTVRTKIDADETKDGKEFNGGRTFPFPETLGEVQAWLTNYAKIAQEKNWTTEPDPVADMKTGFAIRVGKEIREKARAAYGKPEAAKAASEREAPPIGTVL